MNRTIVLAAPLSLLVITASPVAATKSPSYAPLPCDGDTRVVCVNYKPDHVVEIDLIPGAIVQLDAGPGERIVDFFDSDQRMLDKEDVAQEDANQEEVDKKSDTTTDQSAAKAHCNVNICYGHFGQVGYVKAIRELAPQPLFVLTQWCDGPGGCQTYNYPFIIKTRPADMTSGAAGSVIAYHFKHPGRFTAAQQAAWLARQKELTEARLAAPPPNLHPEGNANHHYGIKTKYMAELAPNDIWDDGRNTIMFFSGNRVVPIPYERTQPGGKHDKLMAYTTDPGPLGTTLRLGKTVREFCLRRGDRAACVFNEGPDTQGATAPTVAPAPQPVDRQASR